MIRTVKERVAQTLVYEIGGVILATPLMSYFVEFSVTESVAILVVMAVLCLVWTGVHNTIYDHVEWRMIKRVASDRSGLGRVLHIFSLEASSIVICVPLILMVSDMSFLEAMLLDIGLTVVYMFYGLLFFMTFDYLFPVGGGIALGEANG